MLTQSCRPQKFKDVAGQNLSKKLLKSIIKNKDNAPHSIILQGPFGTGKTSMSRIFARAINCPNSKNQEPCLKDSCSVCQQNLENCNFYVEYDSSIVGNVSKIRELRDTFYYTTQNINKVIVFDECFTYNTKVFTLEGDKIITKNIGQIVNQSLSSKVLCLDSNGNIEVKEVIGWHKLKRKGDVKRYYFKRSDKENYYYKHSKETFIEVTDNHPVYVDINKTKPISELNIGESVIGFDKKSDVKRLRTIKRKHSYYNISEECFQILLGCVLGDGCLSHTKSDIGTYRFRFTQNEDRPLLFDRVYNILGDLRGSAYIIDPSEKEYKEKLYSSKCQASVSSLTRKELKRVYDLTYNTKGRWLHAELFRIINPIGLAFHFMSDGSFTKNRMHLAMHRYTKKEVLRYQDMLFKRFNINTYLSKDDRCFNGKYKGLDYLTSKGYTLITSTQEDTIRYASLIAPYLTEDCMYKVNNLFECQDLTKYTRPINYVEPTEMNLDLGEYILDRIEEIEENEHNNYVYDLTVEDNHNYIVNNIFVHNCHLASSTAQSALLKVIEEAPKNVFFIFATTHIDKLLPTIRSRSLEIRVETVSIKDIVNNLKNICKIRNITIDDKALELIASKSKGHMRNAHMLLDNYLLLGEEDFKTSLVSSREALLQYLISIIKRDKELLFKSISLIETFPIANVYEDFQILLRDITRRMVEPKDDIETKIYKSMSSKYLKFLKSFSSEYIKVSFQNEISATTALMALYQQFTAQQNTSNTSSSRVIRTK